MNFVAVHPAKARSGFTLVELVAATAVAAVVMLLIAAILRFVGRQPLTQGIDDATRMTDVLSVIGRDFGGTSDWPSEDRFTPFEFTTLVHLSRPASERADGVEVRAVSVKYDVVAIGNTKALVREQRSLDVTSASVERQIVGWNVVSAELVRETARGSASGVADRSISDARVLRCRIKMANGAVQEQTLLVR